MFVTENGLTFENDPVIARKMLITYLEWYFWHELWLNPSTIALKFAYEKEMNRAGAKHAYSNCQPMQYNSRTLLW